ncbi:MAG TPA: diacylglycerol kinase family protein [Thermodesulfobacteriota bacterium]|nr:diacylglycerol kinase family protein [Thermodesulfobacteriota bacterium]
MRFRNVHVIINPASGNEPVDVEMIRSKLEASGQAFRISLTEPDTGPGVLARRAVEEGADLVVAAGGDGTVLGTAEGLIWTGVPLGVIPEGTANVFAAEMGIPSSSPDALGLLLGDGCEVRPIDVGAVGGRHFLLRVGIGIEAAMTVLTEPELKNRFGVLAYMLTAYRHSREAGRTLYELDIDGRKMRMKGVTCVVCNSGNLGLPGVKLMPEIDPADGYLNVVVVRQATLRALGSIVSNAMRGLISVKKEWGERRDINLYSVPAREVTVNPRPAQIAARDGEQIDSGFPLTITIEPKALLVAAPRKETI